MTIPPTRYINAGPMPAQASAQPAMAAGQAQEKIGNAIAGLGEKGLDALKDMRQKEEGGKISAHVATAEAEAEKFATALATRPDTGRWAQEWKEQDATLREKGKALGLSPEGQAHLEARMNAWGIRTSARLETQVVTKNLGIAKAQAGQARQYFAGRGMRDEFEDQLATDQASGLLNPAELDAARKDFDQQEAGITIGRMIEIDPQRFADMSEEEFLKNLPGGTVQDFQQGQRRAAAAAERYRGDEMDTLQGALEEEKLTPQDIEAARFISARDRKSLATALNQKDPPAREDHAKAWWVLDQLRELRNDPAITPEMYRTAWNEARGTVLGSIAPKWQGDLKQELGYLSPAGRSPDTQQVGTVYEKGDLEAVGRDAATRAREAGVFGDPEDKDFSKREAAFRKAEDIRLEVKRFVRSNPDATADQVRDFTDRLIGVKIDGDTSLLPAVPPAFDFGADIDRIMALPGMEPGPGSTSAALLPPKP